LLVPPKYRRQSLFPCESIRIPQNSPTPCCGFLVLPPTEPLLPGVKSFPWPPLAETSKKPVAKKFPSAVSKTLKP